MGYLGYKPADKPLTAADITDSIITSAKIVDGTIVNADINASAGLVFTKLASTGTITLDNIQFPATAVASANANNLDDYEEGTWTAAVDTATGFSTGITSFHKGTPKYTKIGNKVFVVCAFFLGNSSGTIAVADRMSITGLPFTPSNEGASGFVPFLYNTNNSGIFEIYTTTSSIELTLHFIRGTPARDGGAIGFNFEYTI
jgi:hypothetical protein